jgi:DNA-binding transcriptional ArsR family regulator
MAAPRGRRDFPGGPFPYLIDRRGAEDYSSALIYRYSDIAISDEGCLSPMIDLKHDPVRAAEIAEILKALSNATRLMIVARLAEGEANVGTISSSLDISQAIVSQQLRILRMSSLVDVRREGGFAIYRLAKPHLVDLLHCLERCRTGG